MYKTELLRLREPLGGDQWSSLDEGDDIKLTSSTTSAALGALDQLTRSLASLVSGDPNREHHAHQRPEARVSSSARSAAALANGLSRTGRGASTFNARK
jgi:hypothetical protein